MNTLPPVPAPPPRPNPAPARGDAKAIAATTAHPGLRRPLLMRTVSIPDDIEDRSQPKATGNVTLPPHIAWSFPYSYNLDNRKSLRACYEQVMTEGLDSDVRHYIDIDTLLDVWDELWLSPHVREAWSAWLHRRGLLDTRRRPAHHTTTPPAAQSPDLP